MRNSHDTKMLDERSAIGWSEAWKQPRFRALLLGSAMLLVVGLYAFTLFLLWVEQREGTQLNDPILARIPSVDFTWLTFGIIYVAVLLALLHLASKPYQLLLAVQAYLLMLLARGVMMYVVPLEPAEELIVLRDPFVQLAGDGTAPTKDLFFSGHTSTLFLLFLVIQHPVLKKLYFAFTVLVGGMVVWQHVHYTIDVLVAPFVSYACYRSARVIHERLLQTQG